MHVLDLFSGDFLVPMMVFAIPIVAIVGGITAGIVKTLGRQRIIELAQRERIAAIERGIDPSKLPPLPAGLLDDSDGDALRPYDPNRRSQGLMIGGLVTTAVGVSLGVLVYMTEGPGEGSWAVGLIPFAIGIALLLSAWLVRPRAGGSGSGNPPRVG